MHLFTFHAQDYPKALISKGSFPPLEKWMANILPNNLCLGGQFFRARRSGEKNLLNLDLNEDLIIFLYQW